jgi:hypothetical protein
MTQRLPEQRAGEIQSQVHQLSEDLRLLRCDLPTTYTSALSDLDAARENLRLLISHMRVG